jgi:LiaI-LiaF-like transmembrane region
MRTDRRLIYLGLFLLVFGGVLLGARQGWIPEDVVASIWQLWPVLLIAIGLSIILAGRTGSWLGGAVAAVLLGAMAASAIQTGVVPFIGCGGGDEQGTPFEAQTGELASSAEVDLTFSCGDLDVATGSGASWTLEGSSDDGRAPTVRTSDDGVEIESSERGFPFGNGGGRQHWDLVVPTEPTLAVGVTLNAGSGRIVLEGARLSDVDLTVNAGSLSLDLRGAEAIESLGGTVNAGSNVTWLPELALDGNLTVNAGSLVICAPDDIGLRLNTGDNPISSNDFDRAGLVKVEDAWETPEYASARVQTELDVTANAGSISLNPSQPCTNP